MNNPTPHIPTKNPPDGIADVHTVQKVARDASQQVAVELKKFTHLAKETLRRRRPSFWARGSCSVPSPIG